jgi:hypothetical protein
MVFSAILNEALGGSWALLLLGARFWLRSATGMDCWFFLNCEGKKGLGSKVAQLFSNLIVP